MVLRQQSLSCKVSFALCFVFNLNHIFILIIIVWIRFQQETIVIKAHHLIWWFVLLDSMTECCQELTSLCCKCSQEISFLHYIYTCLKATPTLQNMDYTIQKNEVRCVGVDQWLWKTDVVNKDVTQEQYYTITLLLHI